MRRDFDLIRLMLLHLEQLGSCSSYELTSYMSQNTTINKPGDVIDRDGILIENKINYHLKLMEQGNFIKAVNVSNMTKIEYTNIEITYEGQEFLELARHQGVWEAATSTIREAIDGMPYCILYDMLKQVSMMCIEDSQTADENESEEDEKLKQGGERFC